MPSIRRPSGGRWPRHAGKSPSGARPAITDGGRSAAPQGIHACDSLGQRPQDVRLTLCLPRVIEKLR
ncbi:MAG: hypothetical protein P8Y42_11330 [Exilibacterium sp.]